MQAKGRHMARIDQKLPLPLALQAQCGWEGKSKAGLGADRLMLQCAPQPLCGDPKRTSFLCFSFLFFFCPRILNLYLTMS